MSLFFVGVALGDGSGPGEGVGVQPAKIKPTTIIVIALMGSRTLR
jgi:hypothetical protein